MYISDLFTLCALVIAILAILPRTRILDITLKLTKIDWFIIVFTIAILHYLQFYNTFASLGFNPTWNLSRWALNKHNVSYLVVLFSIMFLFVRTFKRPLPKSKILKFKELIEELTYKKEYGKVIILFNKHFDTLVKLYKAKSFFEKNNSKPSEMLKNKNFIARLTNELEGGKVKILARKESFLKIGFKKLAKIKRRQHQKIRDMIHEIFCNTLLNNQFIKELSNTNPYLALRILNSEINETQEFFNLYLTALLHDSNSILYHELNNNQNISSGYRYYIPKTNKLLFHLFNDAKVAEKLYAWKPIGETLLNMLAELHRKPDEDTYNFSYDDNTYVMCKCPIYMAIQYFRIMVSEALYQNIKWHMWLYYFRYFVRDICRNYNIEEKYIDIDLEFPTRYSYLLYKIISALRDWIISVGNISKDQENILIQSAKLAHDNSNIVASSILAIGQCIFIIADTEKIPLKFKRYLIEIVYDLYFNIKLPHIDADEKYAQLLLKSLVMGGREFHKGEADYNSLVLDTLLHIDTIPLVFEHFQEALNEVVNHFLTTYGYKSKYTVFKKIDDNKVEVSSLLQGGFERIFKAELNPDE